MAGRLGPAAKGHTARASALSRGPSSARGHRPGSWTAHGRSEEASAMRTVEQVMTRKLVTVHPQAPFKQVARLLREHQVSTAPVVDEQGRLLGMVPEAELALEEEHTPAQPPPLLPHLGLRREQRK